MPLPILSHTAGRLYDALAPLAREDENYGYALAHLSQALATMIDEPADVSRDQEDGTPGYGGLFVVDSPSLSPSKFLPYIGQYVGVEIPAYLSDEAQRLRIRETAGFRRGTVGALVGAGRQTLVGPDGTPDSATVYLIERYGGSAWQLHVATIASETPDPAWTERELKAQVPAGNVLTYTTVTGGDFDTLTATHSSFDEVTAAFSDFDAVRANPAG